MANWIYGSMTVKGPIGNMLNFLNDGIRNQHNTGETPKPHSFILNDDGEIDTHDEVCASMWIRQSSRHFVDFDLDHNFDYDHENGTVSASFTLEVAWGLEQETFKRISEFGLLVTCYGDEWGMMFAQSFVYDNGKMLKDSYRKLTGEDYEQEYDEDYEWEEEQEEVPDGV